MTLSESKDISESPPSSSTLGTQVLGGSGGHQGFGTSLRLHPWGCSGPALAGWAQLLPDCPILFNLSLSPKTFYTGIFPFKAESLAQAQGQGTALIREFAACTVVLVLTSLLSPATETSFLGKKLV